MQIDNAVIKAVTDAIEAQAIFATRTDLDRAVADLVRRANERGSRDVNDFSLTKLVRGLRIDSGHPALNKQTADSDVAYCRALTTGSTPGSYLVPTMQASEIIALLETGGVARAAGVRIWPMNGIQKLNVPVATASPSWVWMAQNSVQTATDPNLSQMAFDLKERRALVAIPNQLLATSSPALDSLLAELIGQAGAAHEDLAFFSASQVSGGPVNLYSASGVTIIHTGGSGNGGNLLYSDILAVLAKAAAVKANGPFCWFASPRTLYTRILGLLDLQSRPLYIPTLTEGLQQTGVGVGGVRAVGTLMGYPVFVSPYIPENMSLGSGSNQSMLIFMNPKYAHIAQDGAIEMAISTERFFDANQTAIRATTHTDFGFSPANGVIVLDGVN